MATQTTAARKPRQPKPPASRLAGWLEIGQEIHLANAELAAKLEAVRAAQKAVAGPVPRYHTQADKAELANIDTDCAEEEDIGKASAAKQADAAHAAVSHGRDVSDRYDGSAYERTYRGEPMTGCGDASPAMFPRAVTTLPVRGATTLGPLDPDKERQFDAVFGPEDSAGPAGSPVIDPPAGPAVPPDGDEEEHEPALDKAPVLRITSNPFPAPLELAPGPIPVGTWEKPGSEDGAKP